MAAATVMWTRAETDEVLAAVSASSTVGGRKKATLGNVKADTRDQRVRHVSGRPRSAR